MLDLLRKSTGGWIVKILIGLIILAFGAWGIGDMLTARQNTTLAKIGNIELSSAEFSNAFDRQKRIFSQRIRQQITNSQARAFQIDKNVLNTMVGGAALDNHVNDLGLTVSEDQIKQSILKNPLFQSGGNFSKQRFQEILSLNNLTEQSYLKEQRTSMIRSQLTKTMTGMVHVPKVLSEAAYRHDHEKRTLSYFVLSEKRLPKIKPPSDEALKKYYSLHTSQYKAPEYRKISFLKLSAKELAKSIKVDPAHIKAGYEKNKARFGTPAKRHLLQLLFPGIKEAKEARSKLKTKKDFLALAKKRKISKADYDLGNLTQKDMVDPKVAKAAFTLKKGEISQPIQGEFVTALVYVQDVTKAVITPFKDVEKEIAGQLALEQAKDKISTLAEKIEKQRATGASLGDIAKNNKLSFSEGIVSDKEGKDISGKKVDGIAARILVNAFASDVGQQNDPVELGRDAIAWFAVSDIIPSKNRDLKDVSKKVLTAWLDNEKLQALNKMSAQIVKDLKAGKTLTKMAKKYKTKVKTTKALKRTDQDKNLSQTVLAQAYMIHKNDYSSARSNDGKGRIIFQVSKVETPEKPEKKSLEGINKALVNQYQQDYLESYIDSLKKRYKVTVYKGQLDRLLGKN